MDSEIKSTQFKSGLVFSVVFLLGTLLSSFVFFATKQVEKTTLDLVDNKIPTYQLLMALQESETELERLLYEYYATTSNSVFSDAFVNQLKTTKALHSQVESKFANSLDTHNIAKLQQVIIENAYQLYNNIESSQTDWNAARASLKAISDSRRKILPHLDQLRSQVAEQVDFGYQKTTDELQSTKLIVLAYSVAILLISIAFSRLVSGYLKASANSERLSLFPMCNPNPVISLNTKGKITYSNPATNQLAEQLDIKESAYQVLLPENISQLINVMRKEEKQQKRVEYGIKDHILQCDMHWLEEQQETDLYIQDITERKIAETKLVQQAYHDQTSNLENGYKLIEVMDELIGFERAFAIGYIEIRDFNHLVSGQGIDATLALLRSFSSKLNEILDSHNNRKHYRLFHISDKVFALLITATPNDDVLKGLCGQIEKQVEVPLMTHCGELKVELDFGFCRYPDHGSNRNALTKNARAALDEAILHPHSSYIMFSCALGDQIDYQKLLLQNLEHAVNSQALSLNFQPQLELNTNRIIGMETLVRWQHGDKWISPGEFIPVAEQSGLIIPLGEWILRQACQQSKAWLDNGFDLVVAVNISPRQFLHPKFKQLIERILAETGLPARNLELEITEGVIMHNEADVIDMLHNLKSIGVHLSIDDFGTGYSSLAYLKQFPIDKLKIDQAFIKNMHKSQADQAIVQTVVDLGKNLGLVLIAEGVEVDTHMDILSKMGCHEIQGYHFARPLKAEDFEQFIQQHQAVKMVG